MSEGIYINRDHFVTVSELAEAIKKLSSDQRKELTYLLSPMTNGELVTRLSDAPPDLPVIATISGDPGDMEYHLFDVSVGGGGAGADPYVELILARAWEA